MTIMTNPENEKLVSYLVVSDKPGRKFITADDAGWGGLILPDPAENPGKTRDGLKVVLMGSWQFGYLVLETLKAYDLRYPGVLNLAGLVTDHPLNPDARISVKKRIWSKLDLPCRVVDETMMIDAGLSHGVPVYTGEIKTRSFHRILRNWDPDVILVCVFGQVIDQYIINLPAYGIYNFHPSDLSLNQGAGPAPYEDLAARNAGTTVWSVHQVTVDVDAGQVIGQSPPVNVLDIHGRLPADPLVVYNKLAEALGCLVSGLAGELCSRFAANRIGAIAHIDFQALFPETLKNKLMMPITAESPSDFLLYPGNPTLL